MINIAHFSDIHITNGTLLHNTIDTTDTFKMLTEDLSRSGKKIDLLVISGDLADSGSPVAYRILAEILDNLKAQLACEVMVVPGNHDNREHFYRQFFPNSDKSSCPARLGSLINVGGWQVIGLDSLVESQDYGDLSAEQMTWLSEHINNRDCLGSILVIHHPPIDSPTVGMTKIGLKNKDLLADTIAGGNVKLILAGHYHHFICSGFQTAKVLVASSTAYQIDPLSASKSLTGYQGSAFSLISLADNADLTLTQVYRGYPAAAPVLESSLEKLGIY